MALTENGCVYSWGNNTFGQLGNGSEDNFDTPTLINRLSEEFIIDICCGEWHSLVLTRNGDVFAFGNNDYGQCGNDSERYQLTPFKINIYLKVTSISCGDRHSIAHTENGDVFCWGLNIYGQLGIENVMTQLIPLQLNLPKIKQIICGKNYTLMLSIDGNIYLCGYINDCLSHRLPIQLNSIYKFIKISATIQSELCVALSEDNKCYIFGKYYYKDNEIIVKELQQTEYTSIDETFAFYEQITYKSLLIKTMSPDNYENDFKEISLLGIGAFSAVFKSKHKLTDGMYAIKKICFEPQKKGKVLNEINILSKNKSRFVIRLYDFWIQDNYYIGSECNEEKINHLFNANETQLLHIQLELCSLTLRDAINKIVKECKTQDNTLSLIGYYIASELYSEILECVQYLHSQNPKIIHRDLKPENILLTNFVNKRFVKLSDFGLSTFHQNDDQFHSKYTGTKNYRAYELNFSTRYSTKVDIYSLGIILQELFCIDIHNLNRNNLPELEPKMSYLVNLIQKQLAFIPDIRPNCDKIFADKHNWLLNDQQLISDECFKNLITKSPKLNLKIEDNFIEFFVQNKYNSKSQPKLKPNDQTMAKINHQIISQSHNSETTSFIPSIASISSIRPIRSLTDANTSDMIDDNY